MDNASDENTPQSTPPSVVFLRDYCTRTRGTSCERCALACPHSALSFADDGRVLIDEKACTRCGICLGICDAFSSTRVTMTDLYARMRRIALRGEDVVLTCKENMFPGFEPAANVVVLPCLAALSPEFWTLALSENLPLRVAADLSYCEDCARAGEIAEGLYSHAISTAEEWTDSTVGFIDQVPEKENIVRDLANPEGVDRRSAFSNLAGEVADIASGKRRLRNSEVLQQFHEQRERARARARLNLNEAPELNSFAPQGRTKKTMWPKRQLLLEALDRTPEIAPRIPVVVSQTDCARCTNALACAGVCPTGARSPHPETGVLVYEPRYCIGCGLCVDACPEEAISLVESIAQLFVEQESASSESAE